MGHFHMGLSFVYMHETTKCVLINNFYFHKIIVMHVWSVSKMLLTIHIPCIEIMVLPCRTSRQSLKWMIKTV